MLLIDGKPYSLNEAESKEFGTRMIWHVPPKPFDKENGRHGIPSGTAFPNTYLKMSGLTDHRQIRVTYYTHEQYDDTKRKTDYFVENTGASIVIGAKGTLITTNPELNYFLFNNPHNGSNPLRKEDYNNPYKDRVVLFFRYDATQTHKLAGERFRAKAHLYSIFANDGDRRWADADILIACKTILNSADRVVPQIIIDWQEHKDEPDVESLRNGLQELADREPLWLQSLLIYGRKTILNRTISRCLEMSEITGFKYNPSERKYTITDDKGKETLFLDVPDKKNPDQFLLDSLFNNYKLSEKLSKLLDKVPA